MAAPTSTRPPTSGAARAPWLVRRLYTAVGFLFVGLALAGVVLPVLPTTPFVLLAAWAFARGNRRFEAWIENHPRFGPLLRGWRAHRIIPLHAKIAAVSMMALSLAYLALASEAPAYAVGSAAALMALGAAYVLRCPHAHPEARPAVAEDRETS